MATAVSALYGSSSKFVGECEDSMLLDIRLRSRMEVLVSTDFSSLTSGSENVTINGKNYTIIWTTADVDLNGDSITELTAKKITVSISGLPGRSLTTVITDNENRIGIIS
jgi:hypothetical protein